MTLPSDAQLDDAVRRVLAELMLEGDPYTSIPLIDPTTDLPPAATVDAIRSGLADAADVASLDTLVTSGRLSEDELSNTFVPHQATAPDETVTTVWADTSTNPPTLKGWNGATWEEIGGGGSPAWGGIAGTLSDQTDLQTALDAKANSADLGTAAASASTDFATAAQGSLADGALQASDAPELVRDTMGTALVAGTNITITVDDAGDTITVDADGSGLSGSGSPYGSVTPASAGIIYTDTAGTTGAWVWVSTGTTNTSWAVVHGDTGWRDVKSLFTLASIGMSALTSAKIRRINSEVHVLFTGITAADTTKHDKPGPSIWSGFQGIDSSDNRMFAVTSDSAQLPLGQIGMREGNNWQFWFASTGSFRACVLNWVTAQAWPTTLPGTAA